MNVELCGACEELGPTRQICQIRGRELRLQHRKFGCFSKKLLGIPSTDPQNPLVAAFSPQGLA